MNVLNKYIIKKNESYSLLQKEVDGYYVIIDSEFDQELDATVGMIGIMLGTLDIILFIVIIVKFISDVLK